jgi:hypothetical protein
MRIADLLGELVNIFGEPKQPEEPIIGGLNSEVQNRPDITEVEAELEDHADTSKMVAPLQQKLELLKRAVGVDNMYDEEEAEQVRDELDDILKIAGVPTASIFDAGDDEPLDS